MTATRPSMTIACTPAAARLAPLRETAAYLPDGLQGAGRAAMPMLKVLAFNAPAAAGPAAAGPLAVAGEYYAFASFRLYPAQRTLLRDGQEVDIGGRAFDLLHLLVLRAGTVVDARELVKFVWPNLSVEPANLRVQIGIVRKVLGCAAEASRAITNVPLRGYCLVLPVLHHRGTARAERPQPGAEMALPSLLTPVVGRDEAIETIVAAMAERKLVTITGPGGVGKTIVAAAAARRYQAGFDGRVYFVDLSQVSGEPGVVRAIAKALACDRQPDMRAALCHRLHASAVLLILDTCEHIVEPVARIAEDLLSKCCDLRLIVASREALRAAGEWIFRLPSLTYPGACDDITAAKPADFTAIRFFVDCIRSFTRYDYRDADLPILAEICRRLDGNPLALELAAARVPDFGLPGMAHRLDNRFTILTRGRRTAPGRHQSLAAAIDWSYDLLTEDERSLLHWLAAFRDAAANAPAPADGWPAAWVARQDGLTNLYEKSLIACEIRNGMPFHYLPGTMKAYIENLAGQ